MTSEGGTQPQAPPEAPASIPPPPALADAIELLERALYAMERAEPEAVIDCIERAKRVLEIMTARPSKAHAQARRRGGTQP